MLFLFFYRSHDFVLDELPYIASVSSKQWRHWVHVLFVILAFTILTNIIAVIFQCGFQMCPGNPTEYELLSH